MRATTWSPSHSRTTGRCTARGRSTRRATSTRSRKRSSGNLADIVSEQSIITTDGKKIVKVPIRSLELPHFRFDHGDQQRRRPGRRRLEGRRRARPGTARGQGPGKGRGAGDQPGVDYYEAELTVDEIAALVFEDLGLPNPGAEAQAASSKSKRSASPTSAAAARSRTWTSAARSARTCKRNAGRASPASAACRTTICASRPGSATVVDARSNAVVLAMMDVSGSMGDVREVRHRAFYFWMVRFLRTKYDNVEIVFIAHHTEAQEVTEEEFFTRGESGGTQGLVGLPAGARLIERALPRRATGTSIRSTSPTATTGARRQRAVPRARALSSSNGPTPSATARSRRAAAARTARS